MNWQLLDIPTRVYRQLGLTIIFNSRGNVPPRLHQRTAGPGMLEPL